MNAGGLFAFWPAAFPAWPHARSPTRSLARAAVEAFSLLLRLLLRLRRPTAERAPYRRVNR